jgi:hydroxyacylglutathione hydrolase
MQRFLRIAPGVMVATAGRLTCTSTLVIADDGACLIIDPAVTVADLAALASDIRDAGLALQAGYATHPHWDHLLWSRELGDVPRYATAGAADLLESMRTEMTGMLQRSEPGHDLELFGQLTVLPGDGGQIPWTGQSGSPGAARLRRYRGAGSRCQRACRLRRGRLRLPGTPPRDRVHARRARSPRRTGRSRGSGRRRRAAR